MWDFSFILNRWGLRNKWMMSDDGDVAIGDTLCGDVTSRADLVSREMTKMTPLARHGVIDMS